MSPELTLAAGSRIVRAADRRPGRRGSAPSGASATAPGCARPARGRAAAGLVRRRWSPSRLRRPSCFDSWIDRCPTTSRSTRKPPRAIARGAPADDDRERDHLPRARASCWPSSATAFSSWGKARPAFADVSAALPPGAKVLSTAVGEGHIVVTVEVDGAIRIALFDLDTLKPAGTVAAQSALIFSSTGSR